MRSAGLKRYHPDVVMTGSGLKRYHPDAQRGAGFLHDVVGDTVVGIGQGIKGSGGDAWSTIRRGVVSGREAAKKSIVPSAQKVVKRKASAKAVATRKRARRVLNDLFGN